MVPAQPLSRKNFGTIPRRRRYLDGASNFGEGENPQQSESSTSPVIPPEWMAGFLFAANQIFRASSFAAIVRAGRRIEQSTWTARSASRSSSMPLARICNEDGGAGPLRTVRAETQQLAWSAASLGTATRTSARTGCRLAAARIGTPGRMRGSAWCLLLPHKSGFSGIAGLDAFVRFLLHLLVRLDPLLARRRRLLSLCRRGDGNAKSGRRGEN